MKYVLASFGVALAMAWAPTLWADSVSLGFVSGSTNYTTAISTFQTTGSMMDGMRVTAHFGDGSSELAIWGDDAVTGPDAGHAVGTNWRVRENGDTFGGVGALENDTGMSLTRLVIDAGHGDAVFDTTFDFQSGTAGSLSGMDFSANDTDTGLEILATYTDRVALTAASPVGDLWRFLTLDFLNQGGLASGVPLYWYQDTDNLKFGGDLIVPLPTAAGMGLASVAVFGLRRRR